VGNCRCISAASVLPRKGGPAAPTPDPRLPGSGDRSGGGLPQPHEHGRCAIPSLNAWHRAAAAEYYRLMRESRAGPATTTAHFRCQARTNGINRESDRESTTAINLNPPLIWFHRQKALQPINPHRFGPSLPFPIPGQKKTNRKRRPFLQHNISARNSRRPRLRVHRYAFFFFCDNGIPTRIFEDNSSRFLSSCAAKIFSSPNIPRTWGRTRRSADRISKVEITLKAVVLPILTRLVVAASLLNATAQIDRFSPSPPSPPPPPLPAKLVGGNPPVKRIV